MIERIGPFHYEGWSCEGCVYLKENVGVSYYCSDTHDLIYPNGGNFNTPSTCSYLKSAIVNHVMEDTS